MSNTEAPQLRILYQDEQLLAVDKAPGVPVQSDQSGDPALTDAVAHLTGGLEAPHRLDRPVSGVVLFARDADTLAALGHLFRQRMVRKIYWAIVEGQVQGDHRLVHALQRDGRTRKSRIQESSEDRSVLMVRTLAAGDRYSLLEVEPEGGAFHQIRAQLAAWGHPIKGDVKYGARRGERGRDAVARSIALHARRISLRHPVTKAKLAVEAPPPSGRIWEALLQLAGIGV